MGEVFVADVKVRFADVDHAGIVYYPRFFHYFHVAMEELYEREFGKTYPEVLDVDRVGFPAVHTEADYRRPVRYGDTLAIETHTAKLGNRSAVLFYRMKQAKGGVVAAEIEHTIVTTDLARMVSVDMPPDVRAIFAEHLDGD